jgi:predicted RNase H-like HicB family nuclease
MSAELEKQVIRLTAIIEREDNGYVSTCPELDIVSQGDSVEDARMNLLDAVEGFFETASQSEIQSRLRKETYITPIMPTVPIIKFKKASRVKHAKAA